MPENDTIKSKTIQNMCVYMLIYVYKEKPEKRHYKLQHIEDTREHQKRKQRSDNRYQRNVNREKRNDKKETNNYTR